MGLSESPYIFSPGKRNTEIPAQTRAGMTVELTEYAITLFLELPFLSGGLRLAYS